MSKKVFTGHLFDVHAGNKAIPGGKKAYIEQVIHPGASLVVPFVKNKLVFIRQYRPVIGKNIWELPAGCLEKGETPYSCAKREVTEETGYVVRSLKKLGVIYTTPGFSNEIIHIYRADCAGLTDTNMDDDEVISVKIFSKKKVREMFFKGKITDSKTIAGLSYARVL